jgi:hypothetical protein
VYGEAAGANAIGVVGRGNWTNQLGVWGTGLTGVKGESSGLGGAGVWGINSDDMGVVGVGRIGVRGDAAGASGYGVYGKNTAGGYAGYFSGKGYFSGSLGIGVEPSKTLDVNGQAVIRSWLGVGGLSVCRDANGILAPCSSDARLKRDVVDISAETDVLAAVARLRGVRFSWDTTVEAAKGQPERREIGMIAQEVEAVLPELVRTESDGYESLDYARLVAFLVEVAKAQQREIEDLKATVVEMRR